MPATFSQVLNGMHTDMAGWSLSQAEGWGICCGEPVSPTGPKVLATNSILPSDLTVSLSYQKQQTWPRGWPMVHGGGCPTQVLIFQTVLIYSAPSGCKSMRSGVYSRGVSAKDVGVCT